MAASTAAITRAVSQAGHAAQRHPAEAITTRTCLTCPGRYGRDGGYGTSWYVDPAEDMIGILLRGPARVLSPRHGVCDRPLLAVSRVPGVDGRAGRPSPAPIVRIIALAAAIGFPAFLTQPLLMALGRIRDTLTINLLVVPVSLTGLLLGSLHSLEAVAYAAIPTSAWSFVVTQVVIRRYVPFRTAAFLGRLWKGALIALVAATAPVTGLAATGWHAAVPIPAFLLSAAAYIVLWALALFLVRHPIRNEIRLFLGVDCRGLFRI
jgi:hypothetical protein